MRIIGGQSRGRRLQAPHDQHVRPTTDRVRESLFSILGHLHDTHVLDAFAGSGALGCEALSRGASFCYFFDASSSSIALVKDNVSRIDAQDISFIRKCPMTRGLTLIRHEINLVFLDPPYKQDALVTRSFLDLHKFKLLASDATIVLEQDKDDPLPETSSFSCHDQRTYGRTRLSFWSPC